ncbi:MAG: GNAT family N-acetyltransferase [Acutalibacteraceae bacterium]
MNIKIREYNENDICQMSKIWNEIVVDGNAFPQPDCLTEESAADFFASQSFCGVAENEKSEEIVGLYILHPNNVGRCGHISNASFAVKKDFRGNHIGELLVKHCLETARLIGFRILQFNAVVESNTSAHRLYSKLGFVKLGTVPGGFLRADGKYEDIVLYYHTL